MIRFFASHTTAANVLMFAIIILGISALPKLQRDTFPYVPPTEVEVRVIYPGATPDEVEDVICLRVEDALDSITGLVEISCDARENIAITIAEMREGEDIEEFYNDVKSAVEAIKRFPDKVEKPTVVKLERVASVASIAITGDMSPRELKAYAEGVKERLKRDPLIAQVRIKGFSEQDMFIEISAGALEQHGISISDVRNVVERQSLDIPAGVMETTGGDLIVRFNEQRKTPNELGELIVVSGSLGGQIKLGDIADIYTDFDAPEDKIIFNGDRAALLEISKTTDQDSLRVMAAIEENLLREKQIAPHGVNFEISSDVTGSIRERLRILVVNGLQGLGLVFLTMWLFFSFRFSFWVTMGLPVSFLGTIYAMNFLGYSLNMMTLVGLLVAIGILMDDAIVISENIAAHLARGKKAIDAAIDGTRHVLPGVVSSFLTTVMIIGPLAFLSGKMGMVLKFLPAVLLITLIVSLVEAFLILPSHLAHAMTKADVGKRSRFQIGFENRFEMVRERIFMPLVVRVTKAPGRSIGIMLFVMLFSIAAFPAGILKFQAFPTLESDVIEARVLLPQGTPLSRTEEVVAHVNTALKQLDEEFSALQDDDKRMIINTTISFNTNIDAYESGAHVATISADLLPAEARQGTIDDMLARWRELTGDLPDVIALKFTDKERGVAGKAIDLRIQGDDLARLKMVSQELQNFLMSLEGVDDVSDDLRLGKRELRVRLKSTAGVFGVTAQAVANELRAAIYGNTSVEIISGPETYDVIVRLAEGDRSNIEDLQYLKLRGPDNTLIPLSSVAIIEEDRGYARIHRVNGERTVTIQASVDTKIANSQEIMGMLYKQILPPLAEKYSGVHFVSEGQDKETAKTGASLLSNLLIGIIGIYLILVFQFKSYLQPVAVMLAIPMGIIGVVWGHVLMGLDLTMPSMVGFATLAGIVVNNNILLVTFIKSGMKNGMTAVEAGRQAARDRYRPIMLTSLTTLAGLLPLLTETSTQAQLMIPLVASLAFGLLTATIASLLLVPSFFAIINKAD
ncbi:MAG: efflux RND transporter permease subunit [Sphingomonadales bacterium]|nr:efflux RND transporter permease subunit [Sphingomonadales bacterium]